MHRYQAGSSHLDVDSESTKPLPATRTCHRMSRARSKENQFLLTDCTLFTSPRSFPQHWSWDVPGQRRNILHLCTECFTFQCVHLHTEVAILFPDVALESLQVLVAKLHRRWDGLGKSAGSVCRYESKHVSKPVRHCEPRPKAVLQPTRKTANIILAFRRGTPHPDF